METAVVTATPAAPSLTWCEFSFSTTSPSDPASKTTRSAPFRVVDLYSNGYTALSSGLILALAPIVTVYLILQKQFIGGLTAGALKG